MEYTPHTKDEVREMLKVVGVRSLDGLYRDVPADLKLKKLALPKGKPQADVEAELARIAAKNKIYPVCLRGAGAYRHYIPSVVKSLTSRSEFVTAYTPYQAEMSQGILQSIFEFQTCICNLTGMDAANASHYDGATAAAEGCLMTKDRNRTKVLVASTVKPQTLSVLKTYLPSAGMEIVMTAEKDGKAVLEAPLGADFAGVYVEQPNYFGLLEDMSGWAQAAHAAGAKLVAGVNPVSLGLLKRPNEYGADIAVGEGQPLGLNVAFGGPYLGFMAATKAMQRKLPGRIVGETVDRDGNRAFVLTLQAREQHIRREKASSNICSNEAHCALVATVYLSAMGAKGLREVAEASISGAHYFADALDKVGAHRVFGGEFFHEFVTTTNGKAQEVVSALAKKGILAGLPLDSDRILWCVTELVDKKQLDKAAKTVGEVVAC